MATFRRCRSCGKLIEIASPKSRRWYCDSTCRANATRQRQRERSGPRQRSKPVLFYVGMCEACGDQMFSSRSHRKRYCSPACRQWAYRQRKSETEYSVVEDEVNE